MGHGELFNADAQKNIRITFIGLIFACVFLAYLMGLFKATGVHYLVVNVLLCVLYAFCVSVLRGEAVGALSSLLRLASFGLMVSLVYKSLMSNGARTEIYVLRFFTITSFFLIVQIAFDYFTERYVFMNGGIRYYGSVGSPIGLAASSVPLLVGLLYYWIRSGSLSFFVLALGIVWVILMTGTRSITFFALCLVWYACVVYLSNWRRYLFVLGTPLLVMMAVLLLSDTDFATRLQNTYSSGGVDNSTSFRIFILETYFSNITLSEVVFGLGLGGFHQWFLQQTGVENVAPHFELLWLLSEFGVFGMLVYFLTGFALVVRFLRKRDGRDASLWFVFVSTGLVHQGFLQVANPFYFYQFYLPYAVLVGVLLFRLSSSTQAKAEFRESY
ncbi:O-antigen ligase family protein [Pseudomonas tussilaginis]|uniref:O-antigen ligase family protein n=1 Tax=Pseudomonas sp. 5 TaxID=1619949 RepID=UPI0012E01B99|nr:O-antigen ligase family protein [Pseudomonas sp. 5]